MKSTLFTIEVHYRGGTYLRQLAAQSVTEVQQQLDNVIDWPAFVPAPKERLIALDTSPQSIGNLKGVWRLTGHIDRSSAVVYIVATVP